MEIKKIEAGCYEVVSDYGKTYQVIKDSFVGGWGVFNGPTYSDLMITKDTKKECLDFIENNCSYKDLSRISNVPDVEPKDKFKYNDDEWTVDDVIYSTAKGKWIIKAHYYNCSIDSGSNYFDEDEYEDIIQEQ